VVVWGEVAEKAGDLLNLLHNRVTVDRNQIVSFYPVLSFQLNKVKVCGLSKSRIHQNIVSLI